MKVLVNSQDKVYLTSGNKALKAKEKCGLTIGDFIGNIDSNNTLQKPTQEIVADFSGVEDVGGYALQYKFAGTQNISSVSFPDLTTLSSSYSIQYLCFNNSSIVSVSFPELLSVTGSYSMYQAFYACRIVSITFPKLVSVSGDYAFYQAFSGQQTALISVSFPELTAITGTAAFSSAFPNDTALESVSFPKLTTVSGNSAFSSAFQNIKITEIEFPELTSISAAYNQPAFGSTFMNCKELTTARFPKLSTLEMTGGSTSGSSISGCFASCPLLEDIYFNALTTTSFVGSIWQFNAMFNTSSMSTSGNVNIHFPSNLQATIQGLQGYPNFGATAGRVTLLFDLPATS